MQFHKIAQLEEVAPTHMVDVIGVVDRVEAAATIQRKDGSDVAKRNVYIRDDSGRGVEVTLWGGYCTAPGDQLEEARARRPGLSACAYGRHVAACLLVTGASEWAGSYNHALGRLLRGAGQPARGGARRAPARRSGRGACACGVHVAACLLSRRASAWARSLLSEVT